MGPDGPASAAWNRLLAPREPGPVSPVPSGLAVQKQLPISEHESRKSQVPESRDGRRLPRVAKFPRRHGLYPVAGQTDAPGSATALRAPVTVPMSAGAYPVQRHCGGPFQGAELPRPRRRTVEFQLLLVGQGAATV
eukprot:scaffold6692_cov107-Isochrysis_galbana.AAC.1